MFCAFKKFMVVFEFLREANSKKFTVLHLKQNEITYNIYKIEEKL